MSFLKQANGAQSIMQTGLLPTAQYQQLASTVLKQAKSVGVTQAELRLAHQLGFSVTVCEGKVETLAYHHDKHLTITLYKNQKQGSADTTDLSEKSIQQTIEAAAHIAQFTQADPAAGLAEAERMAFHYPDLSLYHPWVLQPTQAIELAQNCEAQAHAVDARIYKTEGIEVSTTQGLTLYANTHGFVGHYLGTSHSLHCALLAKDPQGALQRDSSYTVSRDPHDLKSVDWIAQEAAQRAVKRLGARRLKTCQAPVVFQAEIARTLITCFLKAISGGLLYRKASFLLDCLHQPVFSPQVCMQSLPHLPKALGSAPFDTEGAITQDCDVVINGILQTYLLNSYAARRLNLQATGHAGGAHTIRLSTQLPDLPSLLKQMDTGLLVTELLGHGVNLVTGDYSQGAAGFWVEKGEIQYPVEEITIAGNLREMYRQIVSIANDIDHNSSILTGSILIERMTIAGES
jgi:PmbA protein